MPKISWGVNPKRAAQKGLKNVVRSQKIKNLPKGFFAIAGRPSRMYHVTMNYPKVISNQQVMDAWDTKTPKGKRKDKRKSPPKAKVVIRTHNKEYSERIKAQDNLRKENAYLCLKIKWKLADFYQSKKPMTAERVKTLKQMIHAWIEQTGRACAGEEYFVKKNESNPARRLAINRLKFIKENATKIQDLLGHYSFRVYYLPKETEKELLTELTKVEKYLEPFKEVLRDKAGDRYLTEEPISAGRIPF